jgi:hypothetical protein
VLAAVLALAGIGFSVTSGRRLVLYVSGTHPADPNSTANLHDIVGALAIGEGFAKPEVFIIGVIAPAERRAKLGSRFYQLRNSLSN